MEALTFNVRDITILLGLIASIWAVYKIIKEVQEPRKALEVQVNTLEKWHKEDHERIKEIEDIQTLILRSLLSLIEHEINGNGIDTFKSLQREITAFLIEERKH